MAQSLMRLVVKYKRGNLMENELKNTYVSYEIYECPKKPSANGRYVGKTPSLAQAEAVIKNAAKQGESYFIKGVKADGERILLL